MTQDNREMRHEKKRRRKVSGAARVRASLLLTA